MSIEERQPQQPSYRYPGNLAGVVYAMGKLLSWMLAVLYNRTTVEGRENYPAEGGFIIVSNHASFLDPPYVGMTVPRRIAYLAKGELFRIPGFGAVLRAVGAFPVERAGAARPALRASAEVLRAGVPLLVFPEGTRTKDGQLQEARPGVGMLIAQNPQVPIVPVYISGTFDAWGPGKVIPRPSKVRIRIGKPFLIPVPESAEPLKKQLYQELGRQTLSHIRRIDPSLKMPLEVDAMETDGTPVTSSDSKEPPDHGAGNRKP